LTPEDGAKSLSRESAPIADVLIRGLLADIVDPPADLVSACGRSLFDYAVCARGGAVCDPPQAPVSDSAERLAAVLGILGSLLDRDDVHLPSLSHPGSVIWPVVIALGSESASTGDELVRAAILGYEVVGRVACAAGPEHRRLWHPTSTAGVIGAAAAAACLLRLDEDAAVSAVGHATSLAAGAAQALLEGSATKFVHRASAASGGILAARCAGAGLRGTRFGFEGERGFFAATSSVERAGDVLTAGEAWVIEEVVHRYYASNGFSHAAIEAANGLAAEGIGDSIGSVVVTVPEAAIAAVGSVAPRTRDEAWWSAPYAVCVTLLYGPERLEQTDLFDDVAVRRLLERTTIRAGADETSSVTVDGQTCAKVAFKGHPALPLTAGDLMSKGRRLDPSSQPRWEDLQIAGKPAGAAARLLQFILRAQAPRPPG
jgi:2-methylcitrate dehydratase PrpD